MDSRRKNTTDADMVAKLFIIPELKKNKFDKITSLDGKGTFNAPWWPSASKGLKDSE